MDAGKCFLAPRSLGQPSRSHLLQLAEALSKVWLALALEVLLTGDGMQEPQAQSMAAFTAQPDFLSAFQWKERGFWAAGSKQAGSLHVASRGSWGRCPPFY